VRRWSRRLNDFIGTILFVLPHDRHFMDRIATKLWIVEGGGTNVLLTRPSPTTGVILDDAPGEGKLPEAKQETKPQRKF